MCGIAGVLGENEIVLQETVAMLGRMLHRGDSPFEVACWGGISIGTNRLCIIDRDRARQPMPSSSRRLWCVLNGEIYNFRSLKSQLEDNGVHFYGDSDTEVVVKGYEVWGVDLFRRCNGMFALAIVDLDKEELILVRDRFGIKPLYLGRLGLGWVFASELKAIDHGTVTEVCICDPGTILRVALRTSVSRELYYVHPRESETANVVQSLREALEVSVREHVDTDLPIAVFFGGGVDSAIVLRLATEYHSNVTAITVGLPGSPDAQYAERYCRELGIANVVVPVDRGELESLTPEIIKTAEGFHKNLIRGCQLTYLMCREAQRLGFKVVICGEGSDELFCGYADFVLPASAADLQELRYKFISDLHRTQLQRVDRCGMRFSLEIRVPFLANGVADIALGAAASGLIGVWEGRPMTKVLLREAVVGLIPDYLAWRPKMTLMRGAGLKDASAATWPIGGRRQVIASDSENVPQWLTEEERLYHSVYKGLYPLLEIDTIRPTVTVAAEELLCV